MRILLADDHLVVREGLRWMLSTEPDLEIVAEVDNGVDLLEALGDPRIEVDVVLLDLRMPGLDGLQVLQELADRSPSEDGDTPAIIVLSMHSEASHVRRALELGAAGYLLKNMTRAQLLTALREIAVGHAYVQCDVMAPLLDQLAGRATDAGAHDVLTEREIQVLRLVAAGLPSKQIGTELGISETTVKTHLKDIFARLRVANRAEAASKALRLGLIQ
jgi:two-component system, NarL family, response regulator YdfI